MDAFINEQVSIGTLLRDQRLAKGLSFEASADQAGCSASYVHKLESDGVKTPSPRVLQRLGQVLDLAYGELMVAAGYHEAEQSGAHGRYPVPPRRGPPPPTPRSCECSSTSSER
jgi:transcriptional regulator with XRE-family HTH domain